MYITPNYYIIQTYKVYYDYHRESILNINDIKCEESFNFFSIIIVCN